MDEFRKQIVEMASILLRLSTDSYIGFKYMVLADAELHCKPDSVAFLKLIFAFADKNRPLLIEMKVGAA